MPSTVELLISYRSLCSSSLLLFSPSWIEGNTILIVEVDKEVRYWRNCSIEKVIGKNHTSTKVFDSTTNKGTNKYINNESGACTWILSHIFRYCNCQDLHTAETFFDNHPQPVTICGHTSSYKHFISCLDQETTFVHIQTHPAGHDAISHTF